MATLEGHEDIVGSLAVLEGGRLASGSDDGMIKIWNLATGTCVATLRGHENEVNSLAVLEGGRLASGSYGIEDPKSFGIKIWDSVF